MLLTSKFQTLALQIWTLAALRSRKYRSIAAGNSFTGTAANGASRAVPFATRVQRPVAPTTVSADAAGCAQPLAQPEMWIMRSPSKVGAAAAAICGAMARVAR